MLKASSTTARSRLAFMLVAMTSLTRGRPSSAFSAALLTSPTSLKICPSLR